MNSIQKIIIGITRNRNRIFFNLRQKDIEDYCWIKERFKRGNILNDSEFQSKFKHFYRMNSAGLSNNQKRKFFELSKIDKDNFL